MIEKQLREYIAVTLLFWLRDPNGSQELVEWSPRDIRDHILHIVPAEHVQKHIAKRIANGLTRWLGEEEGYMRARVQRDTTALSAMERVIELSSEDPAAENDADMVADVTAPTYPKLAEWIENLRNNMRAFAKEQKRLQVRPEKAREALVHLLAGCVEDAMLEF
jgi:hypothetical protein